MVGVNPSAAGAPQSLGAMFGLPALNLQPWHGFQGQQAGNALNPAPQDASQQNPIQAGQQAGKGLGDILGMLGFGQNQAPASAAVGDPTQAGGLY